MAVRRKGYRMVGVARRRTIEKHFVIQSFSAASVSLYCEAEGTCPLVTMSSCDSVLLPAR